MSSPGQMYNKVQPKILRCFEHVIGSPSRCTGQNRRMCLAIVKTPRLRGLSSSSHCSKYWDIPPVSRVVWQDVALTSMSTSMLQPVEQAERWYFWKCVNSG